MAGGEGGRENMKTVFSLKCLQGKNCHCHQATATATIATKIINTPPPPKKKKKRESSRRKTSVFFFRSSQSLSNRIKAASAYSLGLKYEYAQQQ